MQAIMSEIARRAVIGLNDKSLAAIWAEMFRQQGPHSAFGSLLMALAERDRELDRAAVEKRLSELESAR